ncbi:MAG: hypothetical protein ACI4Q6_07325 [Huintestinicola sp.]
MKIKFKRLLIWLSAAILIIAGSSTAYAWFTNQRKLATITKVNAPAALIIGAGAKESSLNINIGGIDVEDESKKKNFVFCVYSDETVEDYKLQLAHTTNINFVYSIYKADEVSVSGDAEYEDESGTIHYYAKNGGALAGGYLNQAEKIADMSLHDRSYDSYDNVQKNAEPLYWQTENVITPAQNNPPGFLDYYILEISWGEDVINNKETDMIYITAGMS